jgi:hypothetical protein
MADDIEPLRLRLEQVLADLDQLEAKDMPFDAKLLTELSFLVRYFREHAFTVHVVREGQSLGVRIEKEVGSRAPWRIDSFTPRK